MPSTYPGVLDALLTNYVDGTASATIHKDAHDNANDAINKIEATLGVNPHGGSATVAARLTAMTTATTAAQTTASAAIPKSLVDAAGDMIVGTANDTVARVPVGAEGSIWQVVGGIPVWSPAGSVFVSVDSSGSLVGNEPGIDFVAGAGMTITATDDPAASLVHLTFAASGGGSSGVAGGADYVLSISGGTTTATSPIGLSTVSGTDTGSVVQSCITNLGAAGGTIVFQRGTYTYNSVVPAVPTNLNGWLRIIGNGANITLAAGARRFLDVGRTSGGQTLRYVEVGGFTIDAASQTGSHHIVLGTNQGGTLTSGDVAIDQLWVHDIRMVNVASTNDATSDRYGFYFANNTASGTRWDNILLERITQVGGDHAVRFTGVSGNTAGTIVCQFYNWDRNLAPTGAVTPEGFQFGLDLTIDRLSIYNCSAKQAGARGFYVVNTRELDARNLYAENCWLAGYACTNNIAVSFLGVQRNIWRNCMYAMTGTFVGANSTGFWCFPNSQPFGSFEMDGCSSFLTTTGNPAAVQIGYGGFLFDSSSQRIANIDIRGYRYFHPSLTYTTPTVQLNYLPLWILLPTGRSNVTIRDVFFDVSGTRTVSGANEVFANFLQISAADAEINIDGFYSSWNITNQSVDQTRALDIGGSGAIATQKMRGTIRNVRAVTWGGGDTAPRMAVFNDVNNTTILGDANSWIRCEDWDLTNLPGVSGGGITVNNNAKAFVHFEHVRWKTWPVLASAITPGASPYTYQNLDGYPELILVQGGTVSAVDYSADNATFTTTGLTSGMFQVDPGESLKVTYSVVPTMKKFPRK